MQEVSDISVVAEMRNVKWRNEQVYNTMRKIGWCITDNPALKNFPKQDLFTSDIAYLRFHGLNADMWYKGDNVSRYDYMYLILSQRFL